ncbi:MAG TPA: hypothetical protein DCE44_24245 [Verrucomicrobiales bacterium]|nr:hypothetical protein [Verrucomicrobiales bacterium]
MRVAGADFLPETFMVEQWGFTPEKNFIKTRRPIPRSPVDVPVSEPITFSDELPALPGTR